MLWGNGILVCSNRDTLQLTEDLIPFMVIIVLVKTITLTVLVRALKEALISGTILNQLLTKKGYYSTNLFTEAVQEAIEKHDSDKAPFFIYAAYQAVHDPLEAPQEYIDQYQSIPYENRRIFCGMLKAADEGISNITMLLKEKNLLDDTIIIFTTDNGGQTAAGSSNWPLRGNKGTVFEGGVHGTGFVWGSKLPNLNYDNHHIIHVTDWLPTIVEGIAGLQLDKDKWALDGYNVWPTITQ